VKATFEDLWPLYLDAKARADLEAALIAEHAARYLDELDAGADAGPHLTTLRAKTTRHAELVAAQRAAFAAARDAPYTEPDDRPTPASFIAGVVADRIGGDR
jgi:hypothetical protein